MRTQRTVQTYLASLAFTAISLLTSLVATPWVLRALGEERFGAARVAGDWLAYLALLDLGLGAALPPLLAEAHAQGDGPRVARMLAVGVRAYATVTVLMIVVGVAMALAMPSLVHSPASLAFDVRRGALVSLLGLAFSVGLPFRALADAEQRGWLIHALSIVQAVVTAVLAVAFARWGYGVTGQLGALVLGSVPVHVVLVISGARRHPGVGRALLAPPAVEERRRLWALNLPSFAFNIGSRISLLTDNILISWFLGPASAVPIVLTQRLATLAQLQLQGVSNASWAALAELHAQGQRERFVERVVELTRLVAVLGAAALVPIFVFDRAFVARWVGDDQYAGRAVAAIASANAYLLAIYSLWGWVLTGTGRIRSMLPMFVTCSVVNFALSAGFTPLVGAVGPSLATLVVFVALELCWFPRVLARELGLPVGALLGAALPPLALALPAGALVLIVEPLHPGWVAMAAGMSALALALLAASWLLLLDAVARRAWRDRLRSLLRRPI